MEYQEFSGKSVNDAVTEATITLGVPSSELEYEVISEGSGGLFGMFSKEAVIKARRKEEQPDETAQEKPAAAAAEEAPEENAEKEQRTFAGGEKLTAFLTAVLEQMGSPAEVQIDVDEVEKAVNVNLKGENTGDIIGKKGQTLDALQYLASIVANKGSDEYYRIRLDTKNYRERRTKTLENLAKNTAAKVKKTRHKVVLEPMKPYERRIIHAYLQNEPGIVTKSEGEEPRRRVVVYYKR